VRYTRMRSRGSPTRFTHLAACVSEEEDGFTVQVRLYHEAKPENCAWGEETANSFETASAMLGDLAASFAIPQSHVKISVRMANSRDATRH
jgi:hypothetical protein